MAVVVQASSLSDSPILVVSTVYLSWKTSRPWKPTETTMILPNVYDHYQLFILITSNLLSRVSGFLNASYVLNRHIWQRFNVTTHNDSSYSVIHRLFSFRLRGQQKDTCDLPKNRKRVASCFINFIFALKHCQCTVNRHIIALLKFCFL